MDITTSAGDTSEGFYENDGTLQVQKAKTMARTYLKATQGVPTSMNFDSITGDFVASFRADTKINAPTVIYTSELYYYKNGYDVKVLTTDGLNLVGSDSLKIDSKSIARHLQIQVTDVNYDGQLLTIKIADRNATITDL